MVRTVEVGEQLPDPLHNNGLLPLDSRLGMNRSQGLWWRHVAPRAWRHKDQTWLDFYYLNTPLYLRGVPDSDGFELPQVTATEYRWQIRDAALQAAERAGVSLKPVTEMVARFDAGAPLFTVGGVISSQIDISQLPSGSIVYAGHPDVPSRLDVWEVKEGRLLHLMGRNPNRPGGMPVTLYSAPSLPVPFPEKPATDEQIAQIQLKAWRVGRVFKNRQHWCSTFENTLHALGINEFSILPTGETVHGPGDELSAEQVCGMPAGTLLWWRWRNKTAGALYIRDDRARGKARTRRVWGHGDDGSNTHPRMVVVKTPTEDMVWTVQGFFLCRMPDGVRYWDEVAGCARVLSNDTRPLVVNQDWRYYNILGWVE